jgi:glutamine cyclotransferase
LNSCNKFVRLLLTTPPRWSRGRGYKKGCNTFAGDLCGFDFGLESFGSNCLIPTKETYFATWRKFTLELSDTTKSKQVNCGNIFIESITKLCDAIPWITVIIIGLIQQQGKIAT